MTKLRIGHGYDVHRLVENRKLILAGIEIDHDRGLLGHSDADVVLHALCDAILGALALGDIGRHFADDDPMYKDADSTDLLKQVLDMMCHTGFSIGNIDLTIVAQQPTLSPYMGAMCKSIAHVCQCQLNQVNVKATTTEQLGFVGRSEAIAAHCVCLLVS